MATSAIGFMKVLKKMATIVDTQVMARPRERRAYGQISQGYAVSNGVLFEDVLAGPDRTSVSDVDLQSNIVTSKEHEEKRDDSRASGRTLSASEGARKTGDNDETDTHDG